MYQAVRNGRGHRSAASIAVVVCAALLGLGCGQITVLDYPDAGADTSVALVPCKTSTECVTLAPPCVDPQQASCDPGTSKCVWGAFLPGRCYIEGTCFNDSEQKSGNACLRCDSASSKTTWTTVICASGTCSPAQGCTGGTDAGGGDAGADGDAGGKLECLTDYDCVDKVLGKTPCNPAKCIKETGKCQLGQLPAGAPCEDPALVVSECEQRTCDATAVCAKTPKPDGTACGGASCGKACNAGVCTDSASACDDKDPCTADKCDPVKGCVHEPVTNQTALCDDGDACTQDDYCQAGTCKGTPMNCNDGFGCTFDKCEPKVGCVAKADSALCDDGNPCTTDTCEPTAGCVHAPVADGATCDDGSTCTSQDQCKGGSCSGTATCACAVDSDCKAYGDKNLCGGTYICKDKLCVVDPATVVVCDPALASLCALHQCDPATGKCTLTSQNDGKACDDGDACTNDTICTSGVCKGTPVTCADDNPCTSDGCDPQKGCLFDANTAVCDDASVCTTGDQCVNKGCVGLSISCDDGILCTLDSCEPQVGCTHVADPKGCDDGNACTDDLCDAKSGCASTPNSAACDDGNACTEKDACVGGLCKGTFTCPCTPETGATDCDDKNPCTKDSCGDGNVCINAAASADGLPCDDGKVCSLGDTCKDGVCAGTSAIDCASKTDACNTAICDEAAGGCQVAPKPDGTVCNADDNGCTQDTCVKGACTIGPDPDCSGLTDACNVGTCVFTSATAYLCKPSPKPQGAPCDDTKYCSTGEVCDGAGKCGGGGMLSCATLAGPCVDGKCDEASKSCVAVPKSSTVPCDDGLFCTSDDHCDGKGTCMGGKPTDCSASGDQCNDAVCDLMTNACAKSPKSAGASCNDGDACTVGDACDGGGACTGGPKDCGAVADACNEGVCDAATGTCVKKAAGDGKSCDDLNTCTTNDACSGGVCKGAFACQCLKDADCNDNNPCTQDACVAGTYKCDHVVQSGASCSDGNACTVGDVCDAKGDCAPGAPADCSKVADQCNEGVCKAGTGTGYECVKAPKSSTTKCSDGKYCTSVDHCDGKGTCIGGTATTCSAAKCYAAKCDTTLDKCVATPLAKGTSCDDGNTCTAGESCDGGGGCAGGAALADASACDDGDAKTGTSLCFGAKCRGLVKTESMIFGPTADTSLGKVARFSGDGTWWAIGRDTQGATTYNWVAGLSKGTIAKGLDNTVNVPLRDLSERVAVGDGGSIMLYEAGVGWKLKPPAVMGALGAASPGVDLAKVALYGVWGAPVSLTTNWYLAGRNTGGSAVYLTACAYSAKSGTYGCTPLSADKYAAYEYPRTVSGNLDTSYPCVVPCSVPCTCGKVPTAGVGAVFMASNYTTTGVPTPNPDYFRLNADGTSPSAFQWLQAFAAPTSTPLEFSAVAVRATDVGKPTVGMLAWAVGPGGLIGYYTMPDTKYPKGRFMPANNVLSGQTLYTFTGIDIRGANVFIVGRRQSGSSGDVVLVVHNDNGANMLDPTSYKVVVIDTLLPAACPNKMNQLTDIAFGPNELYLVGASCPVNYKTANPQATSYWMEL